MSKYNAKRVEIDGIKFDSELEARYYTEVLKPMQTELGIKVIIHPSYELQEQFKKHNKTYGKVMYEADFEIVIDGIKTVIDIKGMATETAKLKRKLFIHKYDTPLNWICWSKIDGGWVSYDDLQVARRLRKKAKK
jgi:hypothetical protein